MIDFYCRSREVWHVRASSIASDLADALGRVCDRVEVGEAPGGFLVVASCGGCWLRVRLVEKHVGAPPGLFSISGGLWVVRVAVEYSGDGCLDACRRLDLVLFRGGG